MRKNKFDQIIKNLLVLLMILCSGTVIFNIKYNEIVVPIFAVMAISFLIFKNGYPIMLSFDVIWVLFIIFFNTIIHLNNNVALNGIIQISLYVIGTYAVMRTISFTEYRKIFINVTEALVIISILIFLGVNAGSITYSTQIINGAFYQIALLHVVGWGRTVFKTRMCGLFHEPGMFQIIINIALLYSIEDILEHGLNKNNLSKTVLLIIAIILTKSTSGYIMMSYCLSILYFKYWGKIKILFKKILYILISPIFITGLYYIMKSDVVVNKITQNNISYRVRINDLYSGTKMIIEKPFLGYGFNSRLYSNISYTYGMDGISNGFIGTTIMFGVPTIIIYIYLLFKNCKKTNWNIPFYLIIVFVLLEQMIEAAFFFPVLLSFLF